ncbi:hypothetical protein BCR33DRAFT_731891, partial [Rhizoclosmatium globosum]
WIPWNHLFATSLFPTNAPQTTSTCPAAAMANPQPSTIPLNEAGVLMRSEIGPHRSRDYLNCNRHSNPSSSTFQINSINWNFYFRFHIDLHIYIYNFFLFHKQSSVPDIKPSHLSHILWTSVADFGANIQRGLTPRRFQPASYHFQCL